MLNNDKFATLKKKTEEVVISSDSHLSSQNLLQN